MAHEPTHVAPDPGATRVVVADDDVLLREGLASLLQRSRFDVTGKAGDGRELLALVREHGPDLVIVDIRVPPTHATEGLDAAKVIRDEFPDGAPHPEPEVYATGQSRGIGHTFPPGSPARIRRRHLRTGRSREMSPFSKASDAVTALPVEGRFPGFDRAAGWLNSEPLTADDLRGKVVLADFGTYTCINWLRTLGFVRAWAEKYEDQGLVLVGVHTPEFPFEGDTENVVEAVKALGVEFPIALDPAYAVWDAFANRYWPAVYIADAEGRIRHHQFGEGGYEECERVIQQLLREAGGAAVSDDLISIVPDGVEAQADWGHVETPETYVGYQQGRNFASPEGVTIDEPRVYSVPEQLRLNSWALSGDWTVEGRAAVLNRADGGIAFRFHARDVNLVLRSRTGEPVPFRVLVDGSPPGAAHGLDTDDEGNGTLVRPRLYQLVRQQGQVADRTFEIDFVAPGVEGYVFTFG
jgi:CheY-like chemotaxis protein